jgi:protein gp37
MSDRSRIEWTQATWNPTTGGESGPNARPLNLDWARTIRDTTQAAGVAYLHKQHGGPHPKTTGRTLDGRTWDQTPRTPIPLGAQ